MLAFLPAWTAAKSVFGFFVNSKAGQILAVAIIAAFLIGLIRHDGYVDGKAAGRSELQTQIDESNAKIEKLEREAKDAANRVGPTPDGSARDGLCDASADCRKKGQLRPPKSNVGNR